MTDAMTLPQNEVDQIDLPLQLMTGDIEKLGLLIDEMRGRKAGEAVHIAPVEDKGVLAKAQAIYRLQRARDDEFGLKLFSDPSWDILLDLFIAAGKGRQISISSACIASSAPATTALRHLSALVKYGLVSRMSSKQDGRVSWVTITPFGRSKLAAVLQSLNF